MRLGKVLRKYRISQEQTIKDMAKEIGITVPTLSRIETGRGEPDIHTFTTIMKWFTTWEEGRTQ